MFTNNLNVPSDSSYTGRRADLSESSRPTSMEAAEREKESFLLRNLERHINSHLASDTVLSRTPSSTYGSLTPTRQEDHAYFSSGSAQSYTSEGTQDARAAMHQQLWGALSQQSPIGGYTYSNDVYGSTRFSTPDLRHYRASPQTCSVSRSSRVKIGQRKSTPFRPETTGLPSKFSVIDSDTNSYSSKDPVTGEKFLSYAYADEGSSSLKHPRPQRIPPSPQNRQIGSMGAHIRIGKLGSKRCEGRMGTF